MINISDDSESSESEESDSEELEEPESDSNGVVDKNQLEAGRVVDVSFTSDD